MFRDGHELRGALLDFGLAPEAAERFAKFALLGYRSDGALIEFSEEAPLGGTRIGGWPDLPEAMEWPWRAPYSDIEQRVGPFFDWRPADDDGRKMVEHTRLEHVKRVQQCAAPAPLDFVAQIDLATANRNGRMASGLPDHGRLLFFYDFEEPVWGIFPEDAKGIRLVWDESDASELSPRRPPDQLTAGAPDGWSPKSLVCDLQPFLDPLPTGVALFMLLRLPDEQKALYSRWLADYASSQEPAALHGGGRHRIGGWSRCGYRDPQVCCQLLSKGVACGDDEYMLLPNINELLQGCHRWAPMFEIDTDDRVGLMWGDMGRISVWLKVDDAVARRFGEAQALVESY